MKSKKFALLIGNSEFEDRGILPLTAPTYDVTELHKLLEAADIGGFVVDKIIDETSTNIKKAIARFFSKRDKEDFLLLYYSGHGIKDEDGDLYLAAKDTDKNFIQATGIDDGYIKKMMKICPAKRQVIILDCCYSGAFGKGIKGFEKVKVNRNINNGYGKYVLTSSSSVENSSEFNNSLEEVYNSQFTLQLIEGLQDGRADDDNDGRITVQDLFNYASREMHSLGVEQTPLLFVFGQNTGDMCIAHNSNIKRNAGEYAYNDGFQQNILQKATAILESTILSRLVKNQELSTNNSSMELNPNIMIEGDNLIALKSVLPSFKGKVKCVYIDPPFDTRGFFDYQGLISNDASKNIWMEMILPRIMLLREFLTEDGVILISIDDNQLYPLKQNLDFIFGESNWVSTLIYKKRPYGYGRNSRNCSFNHEYILCYSKGSGFRFTGTPVDPSFYKNSDDDPSGPWRSQSLVGPSTKSSRPNLFYAIKNPATGVVYWPPNDKTWTLSRERMEQYIKEDLVIWPKVSSNGTPRYKRYLRESSNLPLSTVLEIDPDNTAMQVRQDYGYSFPKPVNLIKFLLGQIEGDDYFILDAFAGSGTTAQAVYEINKMDGGNRKYILIDIPEIMREVTMRRVKGAQEKLFQQSPEAEFAYYSLELVEKEISL